MNSQIKLNTIAYRLVKATQTLVPFKVEHYSIYSRTDDQVCYVARYVLDIKNTPKFRLGKDQNLGGGSSEIKKVPSSRGHQRLLK